MSRKNFFPLILAFLIQTLYATVNPPKEEYNRIYLATYPRSGNHWMRFLIEEATHIATSSVYRDADKPHLFEPFPWGGYSTQNGYAGDCRYPEKGEIIVIKTHFPALHKSTFDCKPYTKAIRIIRDPIDSFFSFYTYAHGPQSTHSFISERSVAFQIKKWIDFQSYWDKQSNVVTIRYEDLYEQPEEVLTYVLKEIGYQVSKEDIKRAVKKHPPRGGLSKYLKRFRTAERNSMRTSLSHWLNKYNYTIP